MSLAVSSRTSFPYIRDEKMFVQHVFQYVDVVCGTIDYRLRDRAEKDEKDDVAA